LHARARHLAGRGAHGRSRSETRSALVVRQGTESFGIDLAGLAGVQPGRRTAPVPGGPRELVGIVGARGEMWAVHDLGRLIGTEDAADDGHVVLLRHPRRRVGLRVDAADRIETFAPAALRRIGAERGDLAPGLIAGITESSALLIDLDALWTHRAIAEAL
jgi:chemotaxis signal transduction protein